jgi:hypothetical protein
VQQAVDLVTVGVEARPDPKKGVFAMVGEGSKVHLSSGGVEEGRSDRRQPARDLPPWFGADQFGELVGGVVRGNVRGGLLPGCRHPMTPPRNRWLITGNRISRDAMRGGMVPLLNPVPVEVEVTAGRTWGG